jgi:hypothetical protein
MAPQSGAKQNFYCTVYYITLNSNCETQRASKTLKKCRRVLKKDHVHTYGAPVFAPDYSATGIAAKM